jgi:methylated-DNA-protein-cysteine methyltransferase related protein
MTASNDFVARVYEMVARVPYGRVTTYGSIARALGSIRGARMVGWALNGTPPELDLPCHRVVNRYGELSGGWHFGHPDVMKGLLLAEDVPFADEYQVDLRQCLWVPWDDEPLPTADEVDDLDAVAVGEDG